MRNLLMDKKYKNVISLGYWCGPALELRRTGFRSASFPFDWLIVDFREVIRLIESGFQDFFVCDNMAQYESNPYYYIDTIHGTEFYHDFDAYKSFDAQFNEISEKYNRRIKRFYKEIESPTLFIRYLKNEEECEWIQGHLEGIIKLLKKSNQKNTIVFVGDVTYSSYFSDFFYPITNSKEGKVVDNFLDLTPSLMDYIKATVTPPGNKLTK